MVVSDGEDNFSDKVKKAMVRKRIASCVTHRQASLYNKILAEVQREVQKAESLLLDQSERAIAQTNIISQRAQDGMNQLATATGGNVICSEKEEISRLFSQNASELRSQYLLHTIRRTKPAGKTFA